MSLKLPPQLYKWLQSMGLVKQGKRINEFLQLPQEISLKFYDGKHIAAILRNAYNGMMDQQMKKKLQTLKQNSNPAIRLYNWNILIEVLKRLKLIGIDMGQKNRIINLEPEAVMKVLRVLYEGRNKSQKEKEKTGLKVQINELGKKTLLQSANIMQFLIILLSKHFKLSPPHTVNLFLDNNKYLSHLLVKGVKGNYQPIYQLISQIKQNIQFLISQIFCIDEEENVKFFFNALKSCLISKDERTIKQCIELWMEVAVEYRVKGLDMECVKQWMRNDGLTTLFFTLTKHPIYFQPIIQLCYQSLSKQLYQLFNATTEKNLLWSNDKQKLSFLRKFLTIESTTIVQSFLKSQFMQDWMKYVMKISKRVKEVEEVYDTNIIFQTLWMIMGESFEDDRFNMVSAYMQFIKQALGMKHFMSYLSTLTSTFNLLNRLGAMKNPHAPQLYKLLLGVFNSISANEQDKITVMCELMEQSMREIKSLPGGGLVIGIVKHVSQTLQQQQHVHPALLQLTRTVLLQKHVSEQQGVELVQMLSKIIFEDIVYSGLAMNIVYQYIVGTVDDIADSYLTNTSKICLANITSTAKSLTKSLKQLKPYIQSLQPHQTTKHKQSILSHLRKLLLINSSIEFLLKYLQLNDINLKNSLEIGLFSTYVKIKVEMKKKQIAEYLMPVMKVYYQNTDQLQQVIEQFESQHYHSVDTKQLSTLITSKTPNNHNSYHLNTQQPSSLSMKTLDPSILKPSQFAIKDLQTLKLKKQQLKTIQTQRQKLTLDSQNKLKQVKSYMNEKRLIEHGSNTKPDLQYKCLYDFGSVKQQQQIVSGIPAIKLIEFDQQQQLTYEDDLKSVMKKYRKVWRFLFFKYSTFGAKKQQFKIEQKINTAEIWKMLRQYELFPLLKKDQSQMIIKLINDKMKRKGDPQSVTYLGFEQYIIQLCAYGYQKLKYNHIPIGRQVVMLVEQLKKVTREKGGSIQLFQNPQDIYFQQTDVVREYNRRLKQNPQYILPEGYKKYKLQTITYQYTLNSNLLTNTNPSYADVYDILHTILLQRLSISLIQPMSIKSITTLAKPILFQNITQKMKQYKRGYLQPKMTIQIGDIQKSKSLRKSVVLKKQFKPHVNFSLGIKLGLSSISVKNKSIAQQVAYWMHDMLCAIQTESLKVLKGGKRRVQNTLIRRRRVQSLQKLRKQKSQKKQWRKRAQSVKLRLQVQRKLKKQQQIRSKQKQQQDKRRRRAKQQSSLKLKLIRYQQMRRVKNEKEQARKQMQQIQKQKRRQKMQQYKYRVEKYFQKKRQQILQKQQEIKRKKQQQQKSLIEQIEKKSKHIKSIYINNLKTDELILQQIEQIKQQYYQLLNSEEITDQFNYYNNQLTHLFNLLLKYEKSKISTTRYNQIGFNTFNYFCLKFIIVPFIVNKQSITKIFKFVVKEKSREKDDSKESSNNYRSNNYIGNSSSSGNGSVNNSTINMGTGDKIYSSGLHFDDFKQMLFIIAVKGKKLLNSIIAKRNKMIQKTQQSNQEEQDQQQNQKGQQSQQQQQQKDSDNKEKGLVEEYLFKVQGMSGQTLRELLRFLKLPKDKMGVEQRYREAIQSKNIVKPRSVLIEQLKRQMLNEGKQEVVSEEQQQEEASNEQDEQSQNRNKPAKR